MFREVIDLLNEDLVDQLTRPHLHDRFTEVRRLEGAVAAYKARLVNATNGLGDKGLDGAGMLRSAGRMSSKTAGALAATAGKLEDLPRTAKALADGRLTIEHASAIAKASEKTSPHQADAALVPDESAPPADVLAKRSREWTATHAAPDDGENEAARQYRQRSYAHWVEGGMWKFFFEADETSGKRIKSRIDSIITELWSDDGGREPIPGARSASQRGADALLALCGETPAADKKPGGRGCSPPIGAQLLVSADLQRLSDDPSGLAQTVIDGAPLPQAVLERLACNSTITPILFDGPGRPIWVGRDHRSATVAQWRALIARDRGCVGCGAAPERCEAHHVVAWADFGLTDITNLVLVCSRCHHDLHDRGSVLRRSDGQWEIIARTGTGTAQSFDCSSAPLAKTARRSSRPPGSSIGGSGSCTAPRASNHS